MEAVAAARAVYGDKNPKYTQVLDGLGYTYSRRGKYDLAEPTLRAALKLFEEAPGENSVAYIACVQHIAEMYNAMQRYPEAEAIVARNLAKWKKSGLESHPLFLICQMEHAAACNGLERWAESETELNGVIASLDKLAPDGSARTATAIELRAVALHNLGRNEDAAKETARAERMRKAVNEKARPRFFK